MIHNSRFFDNIGQVFEKYPDKNYADLFSKGQVWSKRWLVEELRKLDKDLGTVFICAGWYGTLAAFMLESDLKIDKIRSFDRDNECADIAETMNKTWVKNDWKFKATTLDIRDMTYPLAYKTQRPNGTWADCGDMPNTIINTSCEHIENFDKWYAALPKDTLLVLQSNDSFEVPEHVNAVWNLENFALQTPMHEVVFQGSISLFDYNRFMRIGYK